MILSDFHYNFAEKVLTMRKRHLTTVLFAFLCLGYVDSFAESAQQNKQEQPQTIILKKNHEDNYKQRPKAPDRQMVTCAYDGEELHLSFLYSEGTATLSVTDETLLTSIYQIDTTPLEVTVSVGELFGTVSIEMETEAGNSYYGEIE